MLHSGNSAIYRKSWNEVERMRIVPKGGRDGREEMEGKGWKGRERKCIL